ncbi:MAG: IS4 family transposase [Chloroflexi bacterium]|nr:IS4 family transposase [Chloroflexota bacterium]MBE3134771.1 IS4 family transposase [Acidobacteriota bacterium]
MARTVAELPPGPRLTDYISLGVLAKTFPRARIDAVLAATGKGSVRQRDLPAHVVVYYVIALAIYMQASYREVLRCLLEGLQWLAGPGAPLKVTGKSGISQARTRLGSVPLQQLHDAVVGPIARRETRGAWYRDWRLVALDGSTFDVADTRENVKAFTRPAASRGCSAFPQVRIVSLVESGTHVLFGSVIGPYTDGETTLAHRVVPALRRGMLCLADRMFFGWKLWTAARATGADLLWRIKRNARLPVERALPDGSYLSTVYASERDRRQQADGVRVRVMEYHLAGVTDAESLYRLVTTLLDPTAAPAEELAALYHERWEIETALDELKTHLRGAQVVLRSKTPDLVRQECYGLLLAHFALRGLMHEAALKEDVDPDRLSFLHAVRVVRRTLPRAVAIPPSGPRGVS